MFVVIAFIWTYLAGLCAVWTLADELGYEKPDFIRLNLMLITMPAIAGFGILMHFVEPWLKKAETK